MIVIALAALLLSATSETAAEKAWRSCVDRTATNGEWAECGGRYVERADAALNAEWQKLMKAVDGATKEDLIAEQRAWRAYREKACAFYESDDWGREGHVLHNPGCVGGVIEARTRQLADYLAFVSQ